MTDRVATGETRSNSRAAALLAGLCLRAAFILHHPRFGGDAVVYGELAHNMLAHHVFGFADGVVQPTLIRLPGYPLFLALCFAVFGPVFGDGRFLPVVWVQAAIDLGTCVLLASLAGRLWGRRVGLWVLWLAALCPFTANYAASPLSETLSVFCVTAAFVALERWVAARSLGAAGWGWACGIGLALAYAVLLRPEQGLLAAAVVPVMLWVGWRRRAAGGHGVMTAVGPAAVASAVMVLPLLLWGVRNWRVFHVVQPLAPRYANDPGEFVPLGFMRWYRTWGEDFESTYFVFWKYDDAPILMTDVPARAFDSAAQRQQTAVLIAEYNVNTTATPELDARFARIAAERVRVHPVRYYLWLPLVREADMWLRPRTFLLRLPLDWWDVRAHVRGSLEAIGLGLVNAAYLLLAAAGLVRWRRLGWSGEGTLAAAMLGFVALRCALLLTLDNPEPRYTLECFPVVILLAGLAVGWRREERAT